MKTYDDNNVIIIGLGYVGLTLAVAMAERKFSVIGLEIRDSVVDLTNKGIPHFFEPGIDIRLRDVVEKGQLRAVKEIPDDFNSGVYIITVGTPLNDDGNVRLDMITRSTEQVAEKMQDNSIVIMRSTVKLGSTRNIVKPILDSTGKKYHLAFCPERTLEGKALEELFYLPQIVGGLSDGAALRASEIFRRLTHTIVRVSTVETAEMVKLVDNTSRDVAFAYSNEIARICDTINASAIEVIRSANEAYPRSNLPVPGLVGGPCLSKDAYILSESLIPMKLRPEIILTARKINEKLPEYSVNYIKTISEKIGILSKRKKISLLGLAFKGEPETNDLRGTMAIPVLKALKSNFTGDEFVGFDNRVDSNEIKAMGLTPCNSLEMAMTDAHIVLILNNQPDLKNYLISSCTSLMAKPSIVYDYWNIIDINNTNFSEEVFYLCVGSHNICQSLIKV